MIQLRVVALFAVFAVVVASWALTCAAWQVDRVVAGVAPLDPRHFDAFTLVTVGTGGAHANPRRLGPGTCLLSDGRGSAGEALCLAVLGGLAIGLALKDSLSNVASGVMLVTLKPFRVGDVVEIAGQGGKVEAITIFQTRLRGPDNQTIVLPNGLITAAPIINRSPDTKRRIELIIGIDYGDDIEPARRAAMDVMNADSRILHEPQPDVLVYELGDNSIKLGIRCHVLNDDWFNTRCALLERIKAAFDASGIIATSVLETSENPDGEFRFFGEIRFEDEGSAVEVKRPRPVSEGDSETLPFLGFFHRGVKLTLEIKFVGLNH